MFRRQRAISLTLAAFFGIASCGVAVAQQNFPNRAVRIVVQFPPGGFQDSLARILGEGLGHVWQQPVIVDNKPGAAGIVASEIVAKSPADGYTLYAVSDGPLVINPFLYKTLPYDPVKSFEPIAMLAKTTFVLSVSTAKVNAKTAPEFVAAAKAAAIPMDFGSGGSGGPHHLFMEAFMKETGIKLNHIPYRGGNPALVAVASGEITAAFTALEQSLELQKTGRVTVLGYGGPQRSATQPELPTLAEQGYPGWDYTAWAGLVAPAGTPKPILAKIEKDVMKVLHEPGFLQKLRAAGGEAFPVGSADFREVIKKDLRRYGDLIREAGVKVN
jgi:tripartite-type tricarboxylate transporter receptor subunit TctC